MHSHGIKQLVNTKWSKMWNIVSTTTKLSNILTPPLGKSVLHWFLLCNFTHKETLNLFLSCSWENTTSCDSLHSAKPMWAYWQLLIIVNLLQPQYKQCFIIVKCSRYAKNTRSVNFSGIVYIFFIIFPLDGYCWILDNMQNF